MVVDTDYEYDNNHVVREARNTAKLYSSGSDSDEETESEGMCRTVSKLVVRY
jgi:hypothetical protein